MPEIETSGYRRFWPMRQLVGRNSDGSKRSVEGHRNMITGEFHTSEKGWNGEPPELPSGERDPCVSGQYKNNYEKTFGHS